MDNPITQDIINRLEREAREANLQDQKLVENMERLTRNHDFEMYMKLILGPRMDEIGKLLLQPSGSIDGMVKSEWMKGAMWAFCFTRDMPSVIIATTVQKGTSDDDQDS